MLPTIPTTYKPPEKHRPTAEMSHPCVMTFNRQEFNFYKALIVQYTTFNIGSENMINVKHYPDSPEILALFSL